MPVKFHYGRDNRSNAPVVMMQLQTLPEPLDAMTILRQLHAVFPNEYAQVGMEMLTPPDKKLVLNGEMPNQN